MILRNWANWASLRGVSNHRYKSTAGSIVMPSFSTSAFSEVADCNFYRTGNQSPGLTYFGIAFGSGSTAPTVDDYELETPITKLTSLSATNNIRQRGVYTNDYQIEATQTVKNATASDITISEIVLFAGNNYSSIIFTRDVITPVTLAPNESKTFVVTIDFTQMSTAASAS